VTLIGQPELCQFLKRSELYQVVQRITACYHLHVFSAEESYAYIGHCVKTAGGGEMLFTPGALRQGRGRLRDIKTDKHELRGHRALLDAGPTL
jgi:type II secretory pathway predicted ATPase ExeA